MTSIGDRLRSARSAKGWSQQELAAHVGVSVAVVSRWERGDTKNPKSEHLTKAAEGLGVSLDWLSTGAERSSDVDVDPDPPHWGEFRRRYEHLAALSESDLYEIRRFGGRTLRIRSWTDWERIAEIVRLGKRRPPPEG